MRMIITTRLVLSLNDNMSFPDLSCLRDSSSLQASSMVVVGNDFFSRYEEIISEHDENYKHYNDATSEFCEYGYASLSSVSTAAAPIGGHHASLNGVTHDFARCVSRETRLPFYIATTKTTISPIRRSVISCCLSLRVAFASCQGERS